MLLYSTYTQSGIYNVTLIVSDMGSCNFSDTIVRQVIILSNTVDTLPTDSICKDDFTQIGILPLPDPNTTYLWLPSTYLSANDISNPIASPLNTTQYMLLVSNGICTDTLYQRVVVDNLSANAGNDTTVCQGSFTLIGSANQTGVSYHWSTNNNFTDTLNVFPTNNSFTSNLTGTATYYLQVKNQLCAAIDSVQVTVSQVSITTSPQQNICLGNSTTIEAFNQNPLNPLTYEWQPSSSIISGSNTANPLVNPQNNTTYTVTATDQYGCTATSSVTVNVTILSTTQNIQNVDCYSYCTGEITVNPGGGTAPYSYMWSNGLNTPTVTGLCAGNIITTITDFNNCTLVVSFNITQPPPLNVVVTDTQHVVCNGICDGSITVSGSGGTPPYTYSWISGQTTPQISGLCAGTYTVTVTDSNDCTAVLPITIHDTSNFDANYTHQNVSCYGYCDGDAFVFGNGGSPPYSYLWNNGDTSDTQNNLCADTYSITISESAGCVRNVFITITEPPALTSSIINIKNPDCYTFCDGEAEITVGGGTPPYTINWSNGNTTAFVNNLCDGLYYVTITDTNMCSITDSVSMLEPTPLVLLLSSTNVPCVDVCNGVAIAEVSGSTPPYNYIWSDGQTTTSASNLCAGLYNITVSDINDCNISDTITVNDSTIFPPNIVTYADKDTIFRSQSVALYTSQLYNFTYAWQPSGSLNNSHIYNPIATPTQTTTYYVNIMDQYGCVYTDSVTIYVMDVICDESNIFIPNAFSPNNDNMNDILFVRGRVIDELYLTIYNRWGEMVFETRNIAEGWNGFYKSKISEPGVYVYYLEVICLDKQEFFKKGNITLLR